MTVSKETMELMYWHSNPDWYQQDKTKGFFDDGSIVIKPDAPERAKKSFEAWLKQKDQ